ncbi:hypothetical protein [Streptomyces sp. NBC_01089]|uniref:hypothetical protein n=1 Tax=Streptomyces sp. NBC_01089 TaxID=2903747 RepID=UPI003869875D|nr:hypothetical protein OG510_17475 [Streptomyces sp. NBC_01089]
MSAKKTSRHRERQNKSRAYVDLSIGQVRLTAPKRTARRVARTVKMTVTHLGSFCFYPLLIHFFPWR